MKKKKEKEAKKEKEKKPKHKPVPLPEHLRDKPPTYLLKGNFPKLETKIDDLLKYIYERRTVSLGQASRKFGVGRNTMEEWGEILEESGLIDMHYPIIGQPALRVPLEPKVKGKHKKKIKEEKVPGKSVMTGKKVIINIEIASILILLMYIFLVDISLSQNFFPTIMNYINFLIANPIILAMIFIIPVVPAIGQKIKNRNKVKRGIPKEIKEVPLKKEE